MTSFTINVQAAVDGKCSELFLRKVSGSFSSFQSSLFDIAPGSTRYLAGVIVETNSGKRQLWLNLYFGGGHAQIERTVLSRAKPISILWMGELKISRSANGERVLVHAANETSGTYIRLKEFPEENLKRGIKSVLNNVFQLESFLRERNLLATDFLAVQYDSSNPSLFQGLNNYTNFRHQLDNEIRFLDSLVEDFLFDGVESIEGNLSKLKHSQSLATFIGFLKLLNLMSLEDKDLYRFIPGFSSEDTNRLLDFCLKLTEGELSKEDYLKFLNLFWLFKTGTMGSLNDIGTMNNQDPSSSGGFNFLKNFTPEFLN